MGRLVGIELHNFKSYKGTSRVGFGTTSYFTSIIGPNGSGKSNMMDAISFVLGVRSNQLRSRDLNSLIYRGRIEEDDINTIEDIDEDPDSAYVKAIYVKENGDTLELKREIRGGSCTFTVNGTQVTVNQYSQILKDENILIKARNFLVFQGDVEKIASQSPLELSAMIETVSGSNHFKKEFEDLFSKKEMAHDDTILKSVTKRSIKEEMKILTAKCSEIEKYDKKMEELEHMQMVKFLSKLDFIETQLENFKNDLKKNLKEKTNLQEQINIKTLEYQQFIQSQSDGKFTLKEMEDEIEAKNNELRNLRTEIIPYESKVTQLKKKVQDYSKRIETLSAEAKSQQMTVESAENSLDTINTAYNAFKRKLNVDNEDQEDSLQASTLEMLNEYNSLRKRFLLNSGHLENELRDLTEEKDSINLQIDQLTTSKGTIANRIKDLESKKTEAILKKSGAESKFDATKSQIKSHNRELKELQSKRNEIQDIESDLNKQLKSVLQKLTELNAAKRENARDKKIRETSSTLKRIFPGVKGLLHDLVKPRQRRYTTALTALLGKDLNSIIVDSMATAQECIGYLREQRLGVATFIPLDTIKVTPLDAALRNLHDQAKPAIDVLMVPMEFEKVAQYICGNSMICESIEVAMSLKWSNQKGKGLKYVTINGNLVHKSGLMTGGTSDSMSKKWDQSEWTSLNEQKEDLTRKFERLKEQIPDDFRDRMILDKIKNLEDSLPDLEKNVIDIKREILDFDNEINFENEKINKYNIELKDLEEMDTKITNEIISFRLEVSKAEQVVYSDFCKKYNFSDISSYENKHGAKLLIDSKQDTRYRKEIQKLQQKAAFEQQRLNDYKDRVEKLTIDFSNFENDWIEAKTTRKEIITKIDELESTIEVLKEEYDELRSKIRNHLSGEKTFKNELTVLNNDFKHISKKITQFEEVIDSIKLDKINVLLNIKVESIKMPIIIGSLEDLPDTADEVTDEWDELLDQLDFDYEELEDKYQVKSEGDGVEEKIKQEIEEIQEYLRDMNPDMKARERLETTKEKFKEVEQEFKDAKEEEKKIVDEFEQVRNKRFNLYIEAFDHISDNINQVYQDLTKSRNDDGGSAYLTLENDEDPYLNGVKYQVKLPTKRFQEMENLSGGEKTVAALALLFAIHSYHPSPFFVLDEVDAALDNANVSKIANYISKHKGPNFQFIIISLKNNLFEQSDTLVGIYRDQDIHSSKVVTMDLRQYEQ